VLESYLAPEKHQRIKAIANKIAVEMANTE